MAANTNFVPVHGPEQMAFADLGDIVGPIGTADKEAIINSQVPAAISDFTQLHEAVSASARLVRQPGVAVSLADPNLAVSMLNLPFHGEVMDLNTRVAALTIPTAQMKNNIKKQIVFALWKWLKTTLRDQYQKAYDDLLAEISKNAQTTIMGNLERRIVAASGTVQYDTGKVIKEYKQLLKLQGGGGGGGGKNVLHIGDN